ncbi:MAG: glycosyltransferase family 4 protein, partial [Candidatus Entotheonellia bacterium]
DGVLLALERRVFRETPFIIANSVQAMQQIIHHYNIPASRLQVIYNGVDHTRFHPGVRTRFREQQRATWGVPADEMVLLLVGSGFHRKGLGYLVQALGKLHRRGIANVRAVVVGKGHPGPYQRLAATLGVADRVHFAGLCPEVERSYAAADVLVLPTLYDPFANACLEAMACGLPVLTTEANGAAELLHDGINGCVLKTPLSAETLVERLYDLLPSQRRQALAEAGYHTACEYPFSQALDQTLRVYESALAWHGHTG